MIYDFHSAVILEERESYIGYIREIRIYMSQRNEMCDDFHQMDFFGFSAKNIFFYFARTALTSLFHFEDASLTGHTLKNV